MTTMNRRTVEGLLAYCDYLTAKGYATTSQVGPWKIAARKVFETVEGEGWESLDLSAIDLDDYLSRFQTLAGAQYKAESITAYKRRIKNAIDAHAHYIETGRPPTFRQGGSRPKDKDGSVVKLEPKVNGKQAADAPPASPSPSAGMIEHPFLLDDGRMARLHLPARRLSGSEVNRMSMLLRSMQDDGLDQRQLPERSGESEAA